MTRPLRIGVLLGSGQRREAWQLRVLDRLGADPDLYRVTELVHPEATARKAAPGLFRHAMRLEGAILAREAAFQPSEPVGVPEVVTLPPGDGGLALDSNAAKRLLKDHDLDLVIRMTPASLPDAVVAILPFGEWAFSFSTDQDGGADWTGFRDVVDHLPSSEISLNARQGGRSSVIASGGFNPKFSATRNSGFLKERAVTMLMRELRRLHDNGVVASSGVAPKPAPGPPSGRDLLRYSVGLGTSLARRATKAVKARTGLGATVWTLYVGRGDITDFDPGSAVEIAPSAGEIRADPFLFEHDHQLYLFYEAYKAGDRKAHIAVGRLDGDSLVPLGKALEKEHHLSYPFVFSHDGEIYMIPETNQARRVEVWRCVDFPLRWELHATALEGHSPADSALVRHAGAWWLFTNLSDFHAYEDHCSELHVFRVDGPSLRTIEPHRLNPVVIDGTVARNAGRLFSKDNRLHRPSQRNEHGIYGYGLNIMEIDQLDLDRYSERCVRVVHPDFKPGLMGCHHFDSAGGRFVIDARLND
ncbi:MAG: hypothetical protein KL863_21535 [Rhizobium sp.]|nr:hypothetical protein [Rhizobium sp.]